MRTRRTKLIPVLSVAALLMAATYGISQNATKIRPKAERADRGMRLTQITEYKVMIQDDQPAGQVVDFIVSDGGCIDYIVATYDDQYYLIPYAAADFRYDDSLVFVDLAPARFEQVQFFATDAWPDYYVPAYRQKVFTTFGVDARRGRATFRQNLDDDDDDARDRREENRDRRRDKREDRRDDRRDDRDRNRDRDLDDRDLDDKDRDATRPPVPDRPTKPVPKADPKAPKAPKPQLGTPQPQPNPKKPAPKQP